MLCELRIHDLGVIDEVTLQFAPGLNVLTGETGAGKTMVVSAIELLLGTRADSERIRAGAEAAVVEGRLCPVPAAAAGWVADGDDELVASREVGDGRSRVRVGGRLAPVSALAESVGAVIEVHGQSDTARLSSPAVQRALLDRSGGRSVEDAAAVYAAAYEAWKRVAEELAGLRADQRDRKSEVERLRYALSQIDAVAPEPGEEAELDAALRRLEHAEALATAAATAAAAIADDGGARDALGAGVAALRATAGIDEELDELRARAEGLAAEAQDLAMDLRGYAESADHDPARLEELRDRRAALGRLARTYGPDAAAVVAWADDARRRLDQLETSTQRLEQQAAREQELADRTRAAGARLTAARQAAGARLAHVVAGHLAELAMPSAALHTVLEPIEPGPSGMDRVELRLAANAGEPALPLAKAASGGERSRVALGLRLALSDADETPVLVFDEIDAGIGGQVARAVGAKLADLARGRQVLCVTHLAQLAAFADAHFVVRKHEHGGRTVATVRRLDEAERIPELARMLSGDPDGAAATEHAAQLRAAARRTHVRGDDPNPTSAAARDVAARSFGRGPDCGYIRDDVH